MENNMNERRTLYLPHRDIQDYLNRFMSGSGQRCLVSDAVSVLAAEGRCRQIPARNPDYRAWDLEDPEYLFQLFLDSYLDISVLVDNPGFYEKHIDLEKLLFFSRDVWPLFALRNEAEHIHSQNSFCLMYAVKGNVRIKIAGETYVLEEGGAALLAPGMEYGYLSSDESILLIMSIKSSTFQSAFSSIFASDTAMASFFSHCLYGQLQNFLLFYRKPDKRMFFLIRELITESDSERLYAPEIANAYAAILLGEFFRNYNNVYSHYEDGRSVHLQMPMILRYIRNNLDTVTLGSTAAFFGYDPDYLGKLIKKSTGKYYSDVLNEYKIERSRRLLLYTDHSVEQIGGMCGFSNPNHFFRTFKKYTGTTPAKYRRENADQPAGNAKL